jgi:hypothetical protein
MPSVKLRNPAPASPRRYNKGRPHSSLGPDPPLDLQPKASAHHRIPQGSGVVAKPILGGLHHEYGLETFAA